MTYADAITYCNEHGVPKKGKPLSLARTSRRSQSEKTDMVGSPIFMTHFPDEMEAFCVKHIAEDRTLTGSLDLVMPGVGEIVGESMKIDDDDELISLQGEQARPDAVLLAHGPAQVRDVPARRGRPRDGALCHVAPGRDHIRNVCLYPRYIDHCEPSSSFSGKSPHGAWLTPTQRGNHNKMLTPFNQRY